MERTHSDNQMIWQLPTQRSLDMLHFGEQLFTLVKHTHNLLSASDKFEESSKRKNVSLIEIDHVASKKVGLQTFWTLKTNEFLLQL